MNILAINTVAKACEVAVATAAETFVVNEPMARGHDTRIASVVAEALAKSGLNWEDLDRIAVVVGPGSFTGVRVGVSFARGLGLARNIPVIGITALEALDPPPSEGTTLAILPAQRRDPDRTWWTQLLTDGRGQGDPTESSAEQLEELATTHWQIIGDLDDPARAISVSPAQPTASAAAKLASTIQDPKSAPASPAYVRAPDAAPMKPPMRTTQPPKSSTEGKS